MVQAMTLRLRGMQNLELDLEHLKGGPVPKAYRRAVSTLKMRDVEIEGKSGYRGDPRLDGESWKRRQKRTEGSRGKDRMVIGADAGTKIEREAFDKGWKAGDRSRSGPHVHGGSGYTV